MIRFRPAVVLLLVWLLGFVPLAAQTTRSAPGAKPALDKASPTKAAKSATEKTDDRKLIKTYPDLGPEIRIGLATDAATVTISSTGELDLQDGPTDRGWTVEAATLRFRVQTPKTVMARAPRGAAYHVHVVALTERTAAERLAARLSKRYGEAVTTEYNSKTKTYEVIAGSFTNEKSAKELRQSLQREGYEDAEVVSAEPATTRTSSIRVSYSDDTEVLAATRPILITPNTRSKAPLNFNQAPYRGRLEVFLNSKQLLNVVNVLPLEEYLRGVVPAELSPTGFPQLEALKAQAIAARTYALRHRGQFKSEGFDLLPTPVSQVYGGLSREHELTNRAIDETRGLVAYYDNEPINALYSSTCGGHTENVENIFAGPAVPYLRGVSCAIDQQDLSKYTITTRRRLVEELNDASGLRVRDAVTLKLAGFDFGRALSRDYLAQAATRAELSDWLTQAAAVAAAEALDVGTGRKLRPRQATSEIKQDLSDLGWFAHWLIKLFYGDSHPGRLLSPADAGYLIGAQDSQQLEPAHRVKVAALLQAGVLQPYGDGLLHAEKPITRERALIALARLLERPTSSLFETGVARAATGGGLSLRGEQKTSLTLPVSPGVYLFRQVGHELYPTPSLQLLGGEKVRYHLNRAGEVDFLAVAPNASGASSDRYSTYSHWVTELNRAELQAQLRKARIDVGELLDIVPGRTSASNRVIELKVIGRQQTATITSGTKIRTALGLRDSLFVVEREYDRDRQVRLFRFTGRGWGHGVGLCQVGAYGLALEGYTAEQILRHYYTGISLRKAY